MITYGDNIIFPYIIFFYYSFIIAFYLHLDAIKWHTALKTWALNLGA